MSMPLFSRHNADHVNYLSSGSEHEKEFPVSTDEKVGAEGDEMASVLQTFNHNRKHRENVSVVLN